MIDDYHDMWERTKSTSKLIRFCRNQQEYANKLTHYEKMAVYIACNIQNIGNNAKNGYWVNSSDVKHLMYARNDKEITGNSLIKEIERLSANDVLVDKQDEPTVLFFPSETIEKINAPAISKPDLTENQIDQNLGIYADD